MNKIQEFAAERAAPATPPAERLLALKFLLHCVGDVHQPLHASDNLDRGGNCFLVAPGESRTVNLHNDWDTGVVEESGRDPAVIAERLRAHIAPSEVQLWSRGNCVT